MDRSPGHRVHRVASLCSTLEAEYYAMGDAAKEAVWLRQLLTDLGVQQTDPTVIRGDNQGALQLVINPEFHSQDEAYRCPVPLHPRSRRKERRQVRIRQDGCTDSRRINKSCIWSSAQQLFGAPQHEIRIRSSSQRKQSSQLEGVLKYRNYSHCSHCELTDKFTVRS